MRCHVASKLILPRVFWLCFAVHKVVCASCLQRALELSKKQIHNLLLLRQLHLAKRAQLARDRHQLLQQMMIDTHGVQHSGNGMTRMLRLATDLKANTAEDYCVYNRIVCAVLRGVIILP